MKERVQLYFVAISQSVQKSLKRIQASYRNYSLLLLIYSLCVLKRFYAIHIYRITLQVIWLTIVIYIVINIFWNFTGT